MLDSENPFAEIPGDDPSMDDDFVYVPTVVLPQPLRCPVTNVDVKNFVEQEYAESNPKLSEMKMAANANDYEKNVPPDHYYALFGEDDEVYAIGPMTQSNAKYWLSGLRRANLDSIRVIGVVKELQSADGINCETPEL